MNELMAGRKWTRLILGALQTFIGIGGVAGGIGSNRINHQGSRGTKAHKEDMCQAFHLETGHHAPRLRDPGTPRLLHFRSLNCPNLSRAFSLLSDQNQSAAQQDTRRGHDRTDFTICLALLRIGFLTHCAEAVEPN